MAAKSKAPATTSAPAKGTVPVSYVEVVGSPEKPYRNGTARQLYHADLVQRVGAAGKEGLPYGSLAEVWGDAKTAPKLPKSGKVEHPSGWVAYFVRVGIAKLVTRQVPAAEVQAK